MAIVVDSSSGDQSPAIIVAGSGYDFTSTLSDEAGLYDLTGLTVVVSVRAEGAHRTPIDPDLEAIETTLYDAENGVVRWAMTPEMSTLLAPAGTSSLTALTPYVAIYRVVEDDVESLPLRFHVRLGIG